MLLEIAEDVPAEVRPLVPVSQIVFGTDYPFVPIETTADGMHALLLSDKDLRAIGGDNALAL